MIEIDYKKFWAACIVIVVMWTGLMIIWYLKADEVTKDPCSICAERMGKNVQCTQINPEGFTIPATRIYYPNGTIADPNNVEYVEPTYPKIDLIAYNLSGD